MELAQKNPNIEPLDHYDGSSKRVKCRCRQCGHIWSPNAQAVLKSGCPECAKKLRTSFPEQAIYFYIKKHYPNSINSYKSGFGRSELDIYIPDVNIGIEYDGRRWHKDKERIETQKYDICKSRNITLIRVRERRIKANTDICDRIIYSEYGDTKKYESLDFCIQELFECLSLNEDINCKRDRIQIMEQYYKQIEAKSLGKLYPQLANEWHQPSNGTITPFMVPSKSNVEFYWKCPKCENVYPAPPSSRTADHGCSKCAGIEPKRVRCIETGIIYDSIRQASILSSVNDTSIRRCCHGKQQTAGKKHWEFYTE